MRVLPKVLSLAFVALLLATGGLRAAESRLPASSEEVRLSFSPLVKKAAPAVVNIYTRKVVQSRRSPLFDDPFFRRFFGGDMPGGRQRIENALGSGVIVDPSGLVVTNNHVIEGADEIRVVLSDRREFNVTVVGSDERTDLAILRLQEVKERMPFLELGDSDQIEVGDLVLAIGNPLGVGQTVTSGIVSAVARTQAALSDFQAFIQTDAAINPGNSGGALLAMDGKLAGINTAIFSQSGGSEGIGFAIPANMVKAVMSAITKVGHTVRPWLGAETQSVTSDMASAINMRSPTGALVSTVHKGGPAAKAGLEVGDVIVAVNGHAVDDVPSLKFRLATLPLEGSAELSIQRQGQARKVRLPLEAPPETPPRDVSELTGSNPLAGAAVANMSPALADEVGMDYVDGVLILKVQPGTIASRLRFQIGDMVLAVNGQKIGSVKELKSALNSGATGWRINIRRGDQTIQMAFGR
jgi:Do/DeqQ family serine protease